ncbi:DUF262 domain-containing protein [Citricoccus nitrophenolicus]
MGFQTPQTTLSELIPKVRTGSIQLPDFQRGYVWEVDQVRELLVTIAQGHPLGVIMTLKTGNDQVRFKPTPIKGSDPVAEQSEPDLLLLDGQQRLTSLTQALSGNGIVTCHDNKRIVQRRFYFDLHQLEEADPDIDAAVIALPEDGLQKVNFDRDITLDVSSRERQLDEGYFPLWLSYSDEATSWLWDFPDRDLAGRFLNSTLATMKGYGIPSIELDRATTKEAVSTVFGKVNQGGTRLTVFELLTAKFAGDAEHYANTGSDFRLKDDWDITQQLFEQYPVLSGVVRETEFLQAVMILTSFHGTRATSARKDDILKLELQDYLQWAEPLRKAFVWVARFLDEEHIHVAKDVPYASQLVPLAVLRVLMGHDIDVHGIRRRVRQWYWCGVLGELYSSATESRMARDADQVPQWARGLEGATVPRTVEEAGFYESRLHRLKSRNSAAYKGVNALLMRNDTRDWLHNQPFDKSHFLSLAVDIHHIFPKAWCIKNSIDATLRESIVNKTPLAARTNRILAGVSPAVYMKRLDQKAQLPIADLDAIVSAHCVDTAALRNGDFDTFFRHRREALLRLVEEAMGKPAARDVEEEASIESVGASDEYVPEDDEVVADDITVDELDRKE